MPRLLSLSLVFQKFSRASGCPLFWRTLEEPGGIWSDLARRVGFLLPEAKAHSWSFWPVLCLYEPHLCNLFAHVASFGCHFGIHLAAQTHEICGFPFKGEPMISQSHLYRMFDPKEVPNGAQRCPKASPRDSQKGTKGSKREPKGTPKPSKAPQSHSSHPDTLSRSRTDYFKGTQSHSSHPDPVSRSRTDYFKGALSHSPHPDP